MNEADRLAYRMPEYRQISSEMASGLVYAIRNDNHFLLIGGLRGW